MAMKLKFKIDPVGFPGGARYMVGKEYVLSREETCLWVRRGVVDIASMDSVPLSDEMLALNEANLRPGKALTFAEVITALAKESAPKPVVQVARHK